MNNSNTKKKKNPTYHEDLIKRLKDLEYAMIYLNAAAHDMETPNILLLALRNVIEAQGGFSKLSKATKLARESLYTSFSERGNPTFSSLVATADFLGMTISFVPKKIPSKKPRLREKIEAA